MFSEENADMLLIIQINVLYNLGESGQNLPNYYTLTLILFPFDERKENSFGGVVIQSLDTSRLCLSRIARQFFFAQKSLFKILFARTLSQV